MSGVSTAKFKKIHMSENRSAQHFDYGREKNESKEVFVI